MLNASTEAELRGVSKSVLHIKDPPGIKCGGEIVKDVRSFFSTYERSNELGAAATVLGILGLGAAVILTGGVALVATAAAASVATVGAGVKSDIDRKATKRLNMGDVCYELANKGYRIDVKLSHSGYVVLQCTGNFIV